MTRRVLFNGAVLVRAGGATRVDVSAFQNLGVNGVGVVGVIGEADEGAPGAVTVFNDAPAMVDTYKTGPLADAADLLFNPMNDSRVPGGAVQVMAIKTNQSVRASYMMLATAVNVINLQAVRYGTKGNLITAALATSGSGQILTLAFDDGIDVKSEVSPVLGDTAIFTIQYDGVDATCAMDTTALKLTTTTTSTPADDLDLTYTDYPTLFELLQAINNHGDGTIYTATAVVANPFGYNPTNLDWVTAIDIKTSVTDVNDKVYAIVQWVTDNSSLVTAVRQATGVTVPDTFTTVAFTSGVRGISSDTNWADYFDLLGLVRINQVVALISADLTDEGFGSTATWAAVAADADAHAAFYSQTAGKSERQLFLGFEGTKTQTLAEAATLQSEHTILSSQTVSRANALGAITAFPEWGMACILAGGRAGSLLGEPLTYKNIRCSALTQDASWIPENDAEDLILGGVTVAFAPPNRGFKFDRVITTYTKLDNDALVEESIVQVWKNVAFDLRSQLEDLYTGTRGLPATIRNMREAAEEILEEFKSQEALVDSVDSDGVTLNAYRDITITLSGDQASLQATITLVSGINFQLHTLFAVPATISA